MSAMTFSIMTLSITIQNIKLSKKNPLPYQHSALRVIMSATTLRQMTISITTLSITLQNGTLSIKVLYHINTQH